MTASERFLKTFNKYTPQPSDEKLIASITDIAVRVNKQAKAIECDVDFSKDIAQFVIGP